MQIIIAQVGRGQGKKTNLKQDFVYKERASAHAQTVAITRKMR